VDLLIERHDRLFDDFWVPRAPEVMHGVPRVRDGNVKPSDARGIGVEH